MTTFAAAPAQPATLREALYRAIDEHGFEILDRGDGLLLVGCWINVNADNWVAISHDFERDNQLDIVVADGHFDGEVACSVVAQPGRAAEALQAALAAARTFYREEPLD